MLFVSVGVMVIFARFSLFILRTLSIKKLLWSFKMYCAKCMQYVHLLGDLVLCKKSVDHSYPVCN